MSQEETSVKCPRCGLLSFSSATFCKQCGSALSSNVSAKSNIFGMKRLYVGIAAAFAIAATIAFSVWAVTIQRGRDESRSATQTRKDAQYRTEWARNLTRVNNDLVCGEDDYECRAQYRAIATGLDATTLKVTRMDARMRIYVESKRQGGCAEYNQGTNVDADALEVSGLAVLYADTSSAVEAGFNRLELTDPNEPRCHDVDSPFQVVFSIER